MTTVSLNAEQTRATEHPEGEAALTLAGAGSGKTRVITERISWLIEQGVPPRKILSLTFTNKGADEIKRRVLERTGLPSEDAPRLTTIHALALSFVLRCPGGFGLAPRVSPIDDYAQIGLLKKILLREALKKKLPSGLDAEEIQEKIAFHRARNVPFAVDYTDEVHQSTRVMHAGAHALSEAELAVWRWFEAEKKISNVLDFEDMLALVNRRMRDDPEYAAAQHTLYRHVLLDEAQDTSPSAWEFVTNLVGPDNRNFFVTGDLTQAIFSFAGALPRLLIDFSLAWRGQPPVIYPMVRNHRSVPEVVCLANLLQTLMTSDIVPLQMISHRGEQGETGEIRVIRKDDPRDLARRYAALIAEARGSYNDFAILVRTKFQIREVEGALIEARIPYVVRGGRGLLATEEVRDVLAYLRLVDNPCDYSALTRAASAPRRGIGAVALERLRERAQADHGNNLIEAGLAGDKSTHVWSLAEIIRSLREYLYSPVEALDHCIANSGYLDHLDRKYAKEPSKIKSKRENLRRLREMIVGLAAEREMSTGDIIFQLTMDHSEAADQRGRVTVSTVHAAKGLEWKHVFIHNLVTGIWPISYAQTSSEISEEMRILYVAITRARDFCYLGVAATTQWGDKMKYVHPSRFLVQMGIVPPQ